MASHNRDSGMRSKRAAASRPASPAKAPTGMRAGLSSAGNDGLAGSGTVAPGDRPLMPQTQPSKRRRRKPFVF